MSDIAKQLEFLGKEGTITGADGLLAKLKSRVRHGAKPAAGKSVRMDQQSPADGFLMASAVAFLEFLSASTPARVISTWTR
ncbi:MAG: hypothetical protein R3F38_03940 [Gammaproteobacteria bacterium]